MKLAKPRLEPLQADQWNDAVRDIMKPMLARGEVFNIFKTLAHHPDLMRRWLVFGNHILFKSTLPARERELLILRIGWLCQAEYEWGQHVRIGLQTGLTDEEIHRIKAGPDAAGWNERDQLLLKATDELHKDAHLSDATWQGLSKHYHTQQLMDVVFTVGQYNLVSMALNTLGVQLDEGLPTFANT
jgi:4-carboxymuconolactone decarboxylase